MATAKSLRKSIAPNARLALAVPVERAAKAVVAWVAKVVVRVDPAGNPAAAANVRSVRSPSKTTAQFD